MNTIINFNKLNTLIWKLKGVKSHRFTRIRLATDLVVIPNVKNQSFISFKTLSVNRRIIRLYEYPNRTEM